MYNNIEKLMKQKFTNHILKNGKKQISEKILKKSFKSIQKSQKKSHNEILKSTLINSVPTFRIIKLKKRKSILEIPAFFSSYKYRTSWGIKYIVKTSVSETTNTYYKQLQKTILANAITKNNIIKNKEELQENAINKKKYFKYYRW